MANEVRYSPFAVGDLEDIHEYIYRESGNQRTADAFIERIQTTARSFAAQPKAGLKMVRFFKGGRYFIVGSYVVLYRPLVDGIEISRVLHGAMDLKRFFPGSNR